ncbi:MAG: hypothetical protein M3R36_09055 [Bacteroidota bacterium]|nr:hypothetical protein [Bacteroidota bacterium]
MIKTFSVLISGFFKIALLLFFISSNLFSQEKKVQPSEIPAPIQRDTERENLNFHSPAKQEIITLENEMMAAKRSGNIEIVLRIQEELNKLTGSVTMPGEKMEMQLIKSGKNPIDPDNINAGLVSSVTGVKGINTCTEQIGTTGGRIWSVFVFGPQSGATVDQLRLCYKNFGETTWNEWITLGFSAGNRMWQDQIDVELIEDNTGSKFLWVAFGYATNNYSGQSKIGVTVVNISIPFNYGGYTLNWPGTVSSNIYRRPRITSDNEAYHSNPWIYITACLDSGVSGGYMSGEKVAICYSPYTVTPSFTYKGYAFTGFLFRFPTDFHCDIAYFKNGGQDSILVIESSLVDSSRIILSKTSIFNFVSSSFATYVGNISTSNSRRYQACIASGGGYNNLMIVNLNKYSESDWDIEYFRSTNGSAGWLNGFVDYRTNYSTRADIIGYRSPSGTYACAYSENTLSFVPVTYCEAENSVWGGIVVQMNHVNTNPFTAQPRPGVNYGPQGESCFALWTEYSGSTNVWASTGCSGSVNAIRNIFFRGVIQGFWSDPYMVPDTVTLILRNDFAPFEIVDSSKTLVDNDGYGNFWFTNAELFTNYYIVAKHRNTIETWSASPIQFTSASSSYDFTLASSQAYGNNLIQVPNLPDPLFAFYNGDVNQDGTVDLADLSLIDNDARSFTSGYVNTDVNGDNFVDLGDLTIADNNAANFVSIMRP